MTDMLPKAMAVISLVAVGASLLWVIHPQLIRRAEALGWMVLLGWGSTALVMFAASVLGIAWGWWLPPLVVLTALACAVGIRRPHSWACRWPACPGVSWWMVAMIVLGGIPLVGYVWYALVTPVWAWDTVAIWAFKARVFELYGGVALGVLRDPSYAFCHQGYPIMWPLAMDWVYLWMGRADEWAAQMVPLSVHAGIVMALGGSLWRTVRPSIAMGAMLVYLFSPANFVWTSLGYADVFLQLAYLLGTLALIRFQQDRRWEEVILLFAAAGCAAWCKVEGVVMIGAALCGLLLAEGVDRSWRKGVLGTLLALAIALPCRFYCLAQGIQGVRRYDMQQVNPVDNLGALPDILAYWIKMLVDWRWAGIWIGFAMILLLAGKRLRSHVPMLVYIAVPMAFSCLIYVVFLPDMGLSMSRLIGHLAPTAVYATALLGNLLTSSADDLAASG